MPEYSKNDVKLLKIFGKTIRAKRDVLGISQEEFADKAGLHRTYVGGVEQGRRNVSLVNILKIAKALEVKPSELFEVLSSK